MAWRVTVLPANAQMSSAVFELAPMAVGRAIKHRTVSEVWYILEGEGESWWWQHARCMPKPWSRLG